jgi:hypothetical protein
MEELFTPRATIEHFVERKGISIEDIGVAPSVIVSWGHRVIEQMAGADRSTEIQKLALWRAPAFFHGRTGGQGVVSRGNAGRGAGYGHDYGGTDRLRREEFYRSRLGGQPSTRSSCWFILHSDLLYL